MGTQELLTVLFPTRNRPHNILGQLRLFAQFNLTVVVADSSDPDKAEEIGAACSDRAQLLSYPPEITFFEKLADAVGRIKTPFVLLAADRKITFPHAAKSALLFLQEHEDYVCAQGYVIGFDTRQKDIDINRVIFFTPTIEEADPLWRHYHLMRRYQSRQFSLFRLQPLKAAIAQAGTVDGAMFQEVMFMNALVLQGRVARLPSIFTLQTTEQSFNRLRDIDPFYWFLHDSQSFFQHYVRYRGSLARFISDGDMTRLSKREIHHVLDAIHAVWLRYNFDPGQLNLATQQMLNSQLPNLAHPRPPLPWRAIQRRDVVHFGRRVGRYIWRREVLNAEPREEIHISHDEIDQVENQLEIFFGN
jgi:glycosyltransferase domain-containing protein